LEGIMDLAETMGCRLYIPHVTSARALRPIRAANQHSAVGYTLYEGRQVLGWPELSFRRGAPVLQNGEILARPGQGHFLVTQPAGGKPLLR
jgi:dihydroorotase-like cyclic amidohydrolase